MDIRTPSTRRDTRFQLRPGHSVEFVEPPLVGHPTSADLVAVSVAGLAFHLLAEPDSTTHGTAFDNLKIHVGECVIEGKAVVRSVKRRESGIILVGCLFYPSCGDEDRWMTLIAGIAAVMPLAEDDR